MAIDQLVEDFYSSMDLLPEARCIRTLHGADLTPTKQVLKRYLTEWTGGPKLYSAEKGHPRLRRRHLGFAIGEPERDAWLLCMRTALTTAVKNRDARAELEKALSKLADWMRNTPGNPHDAGHSHP